ncbi:MAG TPA: hypothetical protein GX708_19830 [Gallicola sp.]|nr:hypothetical protein [Gallicola sp.]
MKNLEFMDLSTQEVKELSGGGIGFALLLALAYDIVSNWDDSARSFQSGMDYVMDL